MIKHHDTAPVLPVFIKFTDSVVSENAQEVSDWKNMFIFTDDSMYNEKLIKKSIIFNFMYLTSVVPRQWLVQHQPFFYVTSFLRKIWTDVPGYNWHMHILCYCGYNLGFGAL